MKKQSILYAVSTLRRSGPTQQLLFLTKHLNQNDFKPFIITLSPEIEDSMITSFQELDIPIKTLGLSRLGGFVRGKTCFQEKIKEINPSILHTQGIRADMLASKQLNEIPKLCTIRNFPQYDYIMTYGKWWGKLMAFKHIRSLHKLDKVIGVSKSVTLNLYKKFNVTNVKTILNGVDNSFFAPRNNQRKYLRKKLNLPETGNIWISCGHLSPRKDPLTLISAWGKQFENSESNHLVFVGSGSLKESCLVNSQGRKNIHLVGRVNNVVEYLNASDYFISASKAEGFPNTVLEAMACGLPVLLSSIPPHQEILELNSMVGEQFSPNSQAEFSEAIKKMLQLDYLKSSAACVKLIQENLSANKMSQQYQKVYHDLININFR